MDGQANDVTNLAVALLWLPDGRLSLQRRSVDAPIAAGKLGFFGGHIEAGELPEVCIRRELAEEISLDVDTLDITHLCDILVPASSYDGRDHQFFIFETNIDDDNFVVYEGDRAESYLPAELLSRDDLSEIVRKVLEQHAGQK